MTKQVQQAITATHILGSTGTVDGSNLGYQSKASFVVGTVSQSGGVPTGAIIQRGSNANGEFVRYADGTQICTRAFSLVGTGSRVDTFFTHASSFVAGGSLVRLMNAAGRQGVSVDFTAVKIIADREADQTNVTTQTDFSFINTDSITTGINAFVIGRWY